MTTDLSKQLSMLRRRVLQELLKKLEPKLHGSGWCKLSGPEPTSRPLRVCMFRDLEPRPLPGSRGVDEWYGFTEDGIVTDVYCAIATRYWKAISTDDLLSMVRYLDRAPASTWSDGKPTAKDRKALNAFLPPEWRLTP